MPYAPPAALTGNEWGRRKALPVSAKVVAFSTAPLALTVNTDLCQRVAAGEREGRLSTALQPQRRKIEPRP